MARPHTLTRQHPTATASRFSALKRRAISSADTAFALRLIETTLRPWIERDHGRWNAAAMERHVRMRCAEGRWQMLMIQGESIGLIALEETARELRLEQLFIAPSWQRLGIGRHLIQWCQSLGQRSKKPVRLTVLHSNPARRFYQGCGFIEEKRTRNVHTLAWYPSSVAHSRLAIA